MKQIIVISSIACLSWLLCFSGSVAFVSFAVTTRPSSELAFFNNFFNTDTEEEEAVAEQQVAEETVVEEPVVEEPVEQTLLNSDVAKKFKVRTCLSTACTKKRRTLGMDDYATFSAFYSRIKDNNAAVQLDEVPCLGACSKAPCVSIEHDDFVGPVALLGMSDAEFNAKMFQQIITEEDADRVWSCIENGIQMMAEAEDE